VGYLGKLHPTIAANVDLGNDQIYLFEMFLAPLVQHGTLQKKFQPIPKFPAVYRDLALVVPENTIPASDIENVIQDAGQPLLEHVMLFDRYVGPQIATGHVGLTYSLQYRSREKTLTDPEVSDIHERILRALQTRLGIQLR
jgi:phenylalanyl-tRNA synthetase beta chain